MRMRPFIPFLLPLLLASGCSWRPVEEISGCVDVVIREHLVSGNGAVPELYRAMVYDMQGGIVVTDYLSREGGKVYAPAGRRRLRKYSYYQSRICRSA